MTNWKEQFDKFFTRTRLPIKIIHDKCFQEDVTDKYKDKLKSFISNEIIEKLIADIPDHLGDTNKGYLVSTKKLKHQLSDNWL